MFHALRSYRGHRSCHPAPAGHRPYRRRGRAGAGERAGGDGDPAVRDALNQLPVQVEDRTGYERSKFKGLCRRREVMHGLRARPNSRSLIGQASTGETSPPGHEGAKNSRRGRLTGRLRRHVLTHRAIDFLSTHIPDDPGPGDECLPLVHTRQVVGQVRYRICTDCAQGVIAAVVIDERFHSTGLGTRALSHLRSRHPGLTWRSTLHKRTTRDLLRRMRIPTTASATPCPHAHQTLPAPAGPILVSG